MMTTKTSRAVIARPPQDRLTASCIAFIKDFNVYVREGTLGRKRSSLQTVLKAIPTACSSGRLIQKGSSPGA